MFGFFHFQGTSMFTTNAFQMIDGMVDKIFSNISYIDFPEFEEEEEFEEDDNVEEDDIINFESFNDLYILSIKLKGVDLKELSIRYENDIIDVNLNRLEETENYYYVNNFVKKHYNKTFDKIEQIDTDKLFKSMDNGYLMITMPKKYAIDNSKIIDTEFIELPKEDNTQELN